MRRRMLVLVGLMLAACNKGGVDPAIPTTLTAIPATATAPAGTLVTLALEVRITNAEGDPVQGVVVNWVVESGLGRLSAASRITDERGSAEVAWTLGSEIGVHEVRAFSGSLNGSPVFWRATVTEPNSGGGGATNE